METHPLVLLRDLTVQLEWDEETGRWVTNVPEFNGISTCGRTQEEALDQTRELILGYLASMQALNLRIPLPASAIRKVKAALA